jgi:AbrB family looped-hinge helix DNA binding protein
MNEVTISSKFQVVIPKEIRKKLGLKPKEKLIVIEKNRTIALIPHRQIKSMRGFVKGISLKDVREEEDRF